MLIQNSRKHRITDYCTTFTILKVCLIVIFFHHLNLLSNLTTVTTLSALTTLIILTTLTTVTTTSFTSPLPLPWLLVVDLEYRPQCLHLPLSLVILRLCLPKKRHCIGWTHLNSTTSSSSFTKHSPHLALKLLQGWFYQFPALWRRLLVLSAHLDTPTLWRLHIFS